MCGTVCRLDLSDPAVIEELERLQAEATGGSLPQQPDGDGEEADSDDGSNGTANAKGTARRKQGEPSNNATRLVYVMVALFFMWRIYSLGLLDGLWSSMDSSSGSSSSFGSTEL